MFHSPAVYRSQVESSFWLQVDSSHIYVTAHIPMELPVHGSVVLCHAFAEEQKASYRVLVSLARRLAERGFIVFRFDHRGYGNSGGDFEQHSISDWMRDIFVLVSFVRESLGRLPLIIGGLRLGASLAVLSANELDADGLLLWQPVVNGKRFVQLNMTRMKMQRQLIAFESDDKAQSEGALSEVASHINATSDIFTDFNGYIITNRLHDELCSIDLLSATPPKRAKCLLVQISGSTKLSGEFHSFVEHLRSSTDACEVLMVREQPIWNLLGLVEAKELVEVTTGWVAQSFSRGGIKVDAQSLFLDMPRCVDGEHIVVIDTERGWLKGVLTLPSTPSELGVVFLHGWSGTRCGPHNMFTKLSRALKEQGCISLRFDFYGRGESSGELYDGTLLTMIEDANRVISWLVDCTPARRCVTVGICSGGEVCFGSALHDAVCGMVLWSAPVFAGLHQRSRTIRKRFSYFVEYLRKLFRITTWRKLFGGQVQFSVIFRVLFGGGDKVKSKQTGAEGEAIGKERSQASDIAPRDELQLERARYEALVKEFERRYRKPTLMVYGTGDPEAKPAIAWYGRILEARRIPYQLHLVKGANHSFYSTAWENEVINVTKHWISTQA